MQPSYLLSCDSFSAFGFAPLAFTDSILYSGFFFLLSYPLSQPASPKHTSLHFSFRLHHQSRRSARPATCSPQCWGLTTPPPVRLPTSSLTSLYYSAVQIYYPIGQWIVFKPEANTDLFRRIILTEGKQSGALQSILHPANYSSRQIDWAKPELASLITTIIPLKTPDLPELWVAAAGLK